MAGPRSPASSICFWGDDINYGQIVKIIATKPAKNAATRYSPGQIKEIRRKAIIGDPNMRRVSTSFVERFNLSIRMGNRRMARLTNAFSKKWMNHEAMMNLFFGVLPCALGAPKSLLTPRARLQNYCDKR
jgi:hypothetical protein